MKFYVKYAKIKMSLNKTNTRNVKNYDSLVIYV